MKILLLGGCGYIGTRLFDELHGDYDVVSVDLEWFGKTTENNIKMDYDNLDSEFFLDFEVVILVAGNSSVGMCKTLKPTHENNVDNFINLLRRVHKSTKLIYASSSSLYSGLKNATENDISYSPKCYYDLTKFEIDMYAQLSNRHFYGLRLGTVNGYSRNLRNDLMINKMYLSSQIYYSNPQISRPILDINDLVRAVKAIIEKGKYIRRGIYNIASFNSTVEEIVEQVGGETGKLKIESEAVPTYDFSMDCSKFERTFDFKFQGTVRSILTDLKKINEATLINDRNESIR